MVEIIGGLVLAFLFLVLGLAIFPPLLILVPLSLVAGVIALIVKRSIW